MNRVSEFLNGKKTYIGGAILFVAGGFNALCRAPELGVCLDDKSFEMVAAIGVGVIAVGLRHAISKVLERI